MAHELELAIDMAERLDQQLAPAGGVDVVAAQLRAHLRAGLLGGEQRLELVERDAEQVLEAHDLGDALHLLVRVQAMLARVARGLGGQQADLLVVADRPGGGAEQARDVADAQALARGPIGRRIGNGHARGHRAVAARSSSSASIACAEAVALAWLGRSMHTTAPSSEVAVSTHRAVCMLAMNGASFCADSPLARPE